MNYNKMFSQTAKTVRVILTSALVDFFVEMCFVLLSAAVKVFQDFMMFVGKIPGNESSQCIQLDGFEPKKIIWEPL